MIKTKYHIKFCEEVFNVKFTPIQKIILYFTGIKEVMELGKSLRCNYGYR